MQVAFAWAENQGPAKGHRTLQRLGLLDRAVAHGVNSGRFEISSELAQMAGDSHLAAWAHHQHALALQEQGVPLPRVCSPCRCALRMHVCVHADVIPCLHVPEVANLRAAALLLEHTVP